MNGLRTWIEIDKKALRSNMGQFLNLIPKKTRLMAVVKSNAYGHGLVQVSKFLSSKFYTLGASRLWFGVDSIVEAVTLRREGINNPILVLGSILPDRLQEAVPQKIILTISNFESLKNLSRLKDRPEFHLKIDTGMHRQGFLPQDISKVLKSLRFYGLTPGGLYTHFAAAKDAVYPTHTLAQLEKFNEAASKFKKAGLGSLVCHSAASGGALLFPESHLDMVRVGMGLYGYFPSPEAGLHLQDKIKLRPVLTWKTVVVETKEIPTGSYVGYDLTEKVKRKTKIAVLPIGYWHGYDRGLSSIGEVLIKGKRAKLLGRVSMDMIVVDITDIGNKFKSQKSKVKIGDEVVLIGRQGSDAIWADELALKIGTSQYEFLTRINPLIKRVIK